MKKLVLTNSSGEIVYPQTYISFVQVNDNTTLDEELENKLNVVDLKTINGISLIKINSEDTDNINVNQIEALTNAEIEELIK